jgi:general secretion pathway protein D
LYTQGDWTQRLQQGDFEDVTDLLRTRGIPFDADAVATYFPHANKLVVRGREDALSLTERVINVENTFRLPQVEIETKFIEFSETQLNELRTRWQVNTRGVIPGMASVFPLDNTSGVGAETGGLRGFNPTDAITANAGITANTLDSLLLQGSNQTAPQASTLRFAGILNGRGVTLLINALQSTLGSNMLSAPRLTLKQGGEGTVKIVREFVYPQTYQRPQLTQEGVLTPGVPEDFNFEQPKDVGVTLTVRANQINPSQGFIDLNLIDAQMVDFDGFINFGSDITSFNADTGQSERLVEGVALQPVFTVRRADTSVQLRDGEALLIGGLMREDPQQVADKVPVLGDIPLLGRAFRSNSEQKIKRHLIILCTATLIKPSEEPRP